MKLVQLLEVGSVDAGLLRSLADTIPKVVPVRCEILPKTIGPGPHVPW